jgi:hypothetical protein
LFYFDIFRNIATSCNVPLLPTIFKNNKLSCQKKSSSLNSFDKSILNHVPKLFEILGWITLLGFFQFVATKTNNWAVWTIYGISYSAMIIHTQVYYITNVMLKRKKTYLSLLLGLVFAISIPVLLNRVLDQLANTSVN